MSWITGSEGARLFRPGSAPPLRGTLLALADRELALYTKGSVDFYSTYPGMYVPRPLGIRPVRPVRSPAEHRGRDPGAHQDELEPDTPGRPGPDHHPRGQPGQGRSPVLRPGPGRSQPATPTTCEPEIPAALLSRQLVARGLEKLPAMPPRPGDMARLQSASPGGVTATDGQCDAAGQDLWPQT